MMRKTRLLGIASIVSLCAILVPTSPASASVCGIHSDHGHPAAYMRYMGHRTDSNNKHYNTWKIYYQGGVSQVEYYCGTGAD